MNNYLEEINTDNFQELIEIYLKLDKKKQPYVIYQVCKQIKNQTLQLKNILQLAKDYFKSPDDNTRGLICQFIYEILKSSKQQQNNYPMFQFFSRRCLDILQVNSAIKILYLLVEIQNIQEYYQNFLQILQDEKFSLPLYCQEVRQYFYKMIIFFLTNSIQLCNNSEFLKIILESIDSEKDPRNLVLKLKIIQIILDKFDLSQGQLQQIFNQHLECYYPISYKKEYILIDLDSSDLELLLYWCMCHPKLVQITIDMVISQLDDDGNLPANVNTFIYIFQRYKISNFSQYQIQEFKNKFMKYLKFDFLYFSAFNEFIQFLVRSSSLNICYSISQSIIQELLTESLDFITKVDIKDKQIIYHMKVIQTIAQASIECFQKSFLGYVCVFIKNFEHQNIQSAIKFLEYIIQFLNIQIQNESLSDQYKNIDIDSLQNALIQAFDLTKQDSLKILILKVFLQINKIFPLDDNNPVKVSTQYLYFSNISSVLKNCILDFIFNTQQNLFIQEVKAVVFEEESDFNEDQIYFIKNLFLIQDVEINIYVKKQCQNSQNQRRILQVLKIILDLQTQNKNIENSTSLRMFKIIKTIINNERNIHLNDNMLKIIKKIIKNILKNQNVQGDDIINWLYYQLVNQQNISIKNMIIEIFKHIKLYKLQIITDLKSACQLQTYFKGYIQCFNIELTAENRQLIQQLFHNLDSSNQNIFFEILNVLFHQNCSEFFTILSQLIDKYDNLKERISYEELFQCLIPLKRQSLQISQNQQKEDSGCCGGGSKTQSSQEGGCCGGGGGQSKKQSESCCSKKSQEQNFLPIQIQTIFELFYQKIQNLYLQQQNKEHKQQLMNIVLRILLVSSQEAINQVNIFNLIIQEMNIENKNLKKNLYLLSKLINNDKKLPAEHENQIFQCILDIITLSEGNGIIKNRIQFNTSYIQFRCQLIRLAGRHRFILKMKSSINLRKKQIILKGQQENGPDLLTIYGLFFDCLIFLQYLINKLIMDILKDELYLLKFNKINPKDKARRLTRGYILKLPKTQRGQKDQCSPKYFQNQQISSQTIFKVNDGTKLSDLNQINQMQKIQMHNLQKSTFDTPNSQHKINFFQQTPKINIFSCLNKQKFHKDQNYQTKQSILKYFSPNIKQKQQEKYIKPYQHQQKSQQKIINQNLKKQSDDLQKFNIQKYQQQQIENFNFHISQEIQQILKQNQQKETYEQYQKEKVDSEKFKFFNDNKIEKIQYKFKNQIFKDDDDFEIFQ